LIDVSAGLVSSISHHGLLVIVLVVVIAIIIRRRMAPSFASLFDNLGNTLTRAMNGSVGCGFLQKPSETALGKLLLDWSCCTAAGGTKFITLGAARWAISAWRTGTANYRNNAMLLLFRATPTLTR
jgi:hypothetical protein